MSRAESARVSRRVGPEPRGRGAWGTMEPPPERNRPSPMRTPARRRTPRLLLLAAALLWLPACSGDDTEVAADPADGSSASTPADLAPLAAPGPVRTRDLVVVMDTGDGAEMCLGPVAESYPPQCSGPRLEGWSWRGQGGVEKVGPVRWGSYALSGTWDGEVLAVTDAVPAALYSPPRDEQDPPPPLRQRDETSVTEIAREVSGLPQVAGAYVEDAQVVAEVAYDDGTLQRSLDEEYGANTVRVLAQLVDAG